MLGGDECDRLAEVAHLVHGQDGLVGELESVALFAGNVAVREDGVNAGHALASAVLMPLTCAAECGLRTVWP